MSTSHTAAVVIAGLGFGAALGIAAGTYVLAPNLPVSGGNRSELAAENEKLQLQVDIANAQSASADSMISSLAGEIVQSTLTDRPVLVIRTDDSSGEDYDTIQALLRKAGAVNAGTITLDKSFFSPDGTDKLKSIVANTLPAGAQLSEDNLAPGVHAGEAFNAILTINPENKEPRAKTEERDTLLHALRDSGFLTYEEGSLAPAVAIVLIIGGNDGGGDNGVPARNQADFAMALHTNSTPTVLAGRVTAASTTGPIGLVRAGDGGGISTVDSSDRAFGRIATVLAVREQLEGHKGAYGAAASAEAASPNPIRDQAPPK